MNTFNKDLIVLIDCADLKFIDPILLKNCDRLAMTLGAMSALEQNKLSYLTFDDFYDYRQFRIDNAELMKATEDLFSVLDKKYEPLLGFPRAFTGNIYWFLCLFGNMYYISRICEKIDKNYNKVYFVGSPVHNTLFKIDLEFTSKGPTFHKFIRGLDNKVGMFRVCLPSKFIWLNNVYPKRLSLNINSYRSICTIKQLPKRALLKFKSFLSNLARKEKKVIFVIQDGYEVGLVKKYMPEFLFINPISRLLRMIKNGNMNTANINKQFSEELEKFVNEWFPQFKKYVFELFTIYHNKILCCLNPFLENLKETFHRYEPIALFYSRGANRVYEDLYAYFANQRNTSIFYFQHGGTDIFRRQPFQKYLEQNNNIKKINILQSKVEKEFFTKNDFSESEALGSIKLHNLFLNSSKGTSKKQNKILYCSSFFNSYSYGTLMRHAPDRYLFEVNKDVIDTVNEFKLKMDIKLHPCDENYNYLYFKSLLRGQQSKNIRVLKGFSAEEIIKNYGILILDCIVTALFPVSIVVGIPVILYLKDTSWLREEAISDMEKRFYLVRNKSDLERCISSYSRGELKSKFSLDIVDKYAFPIDSGDVGVSISRYIRGKILSKG